MLKEIEKSKLGSSEASDFEILELKANLNPEQRAYLDVLKDKMKKILGNKTKQELAKAGDLTSLLKYKEIVADILKFLRTKKRKLEFPENDKDLVTKQIKDIERAIYDIENASEYEDWHDYMIKELINQKKIINKSPQEKTQILELEPIIIKAAEIIPEKDVWGAVKEIEKISDENLFLINKIIDDEGRLLYLRLGRVNNPETEYVYVLKGENVYNFSDETIIRNRHVDLATRRPAGEKELAVYSESEKKWSVIH